MTSQAQPTTFDRSTVPTKVGLDEIEVLPTFDAVQFYSDEPQPPRTVLVVDDERTLLEVMRRILEQRGYRVLSAFDGLEAVEIVRGGQRIDLAFLDVVMPRMDGPQAVAEIRRQAGEEVPMVLVSGRSESRTVRRGYAAGADYYVTKPFRPETIRNLATLLLDDAGDGQPAGALGV